MSRVKKRLQVKKELCRGCRACEQACVMVRGSAAAAGRPCIAVELDGAPGRNAPRVCRQCLKPACLRACKFNAISRDRATGALMIDPLACSGCRACLAACPYGGAMFDPDRRVAYLCNLCGGDPACAAACRAQGQDGAAALAYAVVKRDEEP